MVDGREHAVWALFRDWCAARDYPLLPAQPLTVARFLDENPAAAGTQRRRIGVINAQHRRAGLHPPGSAQTVRAQLDSRHRERARLRAEDVPSAIQRLPEQGWPTALFARRDAALLVLGVAAVPYTQIATLRLGDVACDEHPDRLHIRCRDGDTYETPELLPARGVSPCAVWRTWRQVRRLQHGLLGPRTVAAYLRGEPVPAPAEPPDDLAAFTPIDRWGDSGLRPPALSKAAIGAIVGEHLSGSAKVHPPLPVTVPDPPTPEPDPPQPDPLDPNSFTAGVLARRRAAEALAGIPDVLDDVERRADRLLGDLLRLLDDEPAER